VGLSPDCTAATPRLRSSVSVEWFRARASLFISTTISTRRRRHGNYFAKLNNWWTRQASFQIAIRSTSSSFNPIAGVIVELGRARACVCGHELRVLCMPSLAARRSLILPSKSDLTA
jgi:hypothetical protein